MSDYHDLFNLEVLALDCQATGANPDKGRLLEIGWITGRAASTSIPEISSAEACLVRPPSQKPIPPVVQRLTGISDSMMTRAVAQDTAWRHLSKTAGTIAARNQRVLCPTVIHFARYEAPFLRQLHEACSPDAPFPLHIICTHAIAARLLPELPRRGIRAVAGYLGHSMPELKRSADHALATLIIWKAMVETLRTRFKIGSLQKLDQWLAATPVPVGTKRTFPMNPGIRLSLPDNPGVYRMRRANTDILYIGKAKSLRQRVNSYFRSHAAHPEHILEMLSQARDIDFSPTASALEAAVLESDEIKRHCPPYNKALRPEQRRLVFFTRDLRQHAGQCGRLHCIGPLPDGRLTEALEAFGAWVACGTDLAEEDISRIGYAVLARPLIHGEPEFQCLKEGFDFFRSSYQPYLQHRSALRIVTLLGAQLRRRQLEAMACHQEDMEMLPESGDAAAPEEVAVEDEPTWTPAGVAGAIEGLLMHGAYLMRRARWYCLLSESSIAWASEEDPELLKNLIVFENGRISRRGVLRAGREVPAPPGGGRPWRDRLKSLDLAAYDRMRVVTTELRRLVCKDRRIELRLGPRVSLTLWELKKAMKWV